MAKIEEIYGEDRDDMYEYGMYKRENENNVSVYVENEEDDQLPDETKNPQIVQQAIAMLMTWMGY